MERNTDGYGQDLEAANCATKRLQWVFENGASQGERIVERAWSKFSKRRRHPCNEVESFLEDMMPLLDEIELKKDETEKDMARCRFSGAFEGLLNALDVLQQTCVDRCFKTGYRIGAIVGKAYCDLVVASEGDVTPQDWLRQPVNTCGFGFELACDARFLSFTKDYANTEGRCAPYTAPPFETLWDTSRLKYCAAQENRRSLP